MSMRELQYTPENHRDGMPLLVLGLVLLVAGLITLAKGWFAPAMVMLIAMPVLIALGVGKLTEPKISLSLNAEQLQFYHRRGQFSIAWSDIQRIDKASVGRGFLRRDLPYIGFRLRDPDGILNTISRRLAVGLLTEQRGVLLMALRSECPDCKPDDLFENTIYHSPNGKLYRGVYAMFGERMKKMRELTGFDVLISEDLAGEDGLAVLRRYWSNALRVANHDD